MAGLALVAAACDEPEPPPRSTPSPAPRPEPVLDAAPAKAQIGADTDTYVRPLPISDSNALLEKVKVDRVGLDYSVRKGSGAPSLWDTFANTHYQGQFKGITTKNWLANWQLYKSRILTLADERGFDDESLARCFRKIDPAPNDKIALLPIGAFLAKRGDQPVWIIVCNWEWSPNSSNFSESDPTPMYLRMIHIRAWAFTARGCRQIDYMTCG